jgi:hypothetical protein
MTDKQIRWLKAQKRWFKQEMEDWDRREEAENYAYAEGAYLAYVAVLEMLKEKSDDGKL